MAFICPKGATGICTGKNVFYGNWTSNFEGGWPKSAITLNARGRENWKGQPDQKTTPHPGGDLHPRSENTFNKYALDDKEALIAAGLAPEPIEDLPPRCGALKEARAEWRKEWNTANKSALEWKEQSPIAYGLRKKLLTDFLYAFRKHPDLVKEVKAISPIGFAGNGKRRLIGFQNCSIIGYG